MSGFPEPRHLHLRARYWAARHRDQHQPQGVRTRYAYDDRGQVTRVWGNAAIPIQYAYDGLGRKTQMHTYRDDTVD